MFGRTLLTAITSASLGVEGVRIERQRRGKRIAGMPVMNYELRQVGMADVSMQEQDWVVMVDSETSDNEISAMCARSKRGCKMVGRPSEGGVPFLTLSGTEDDVEAVVQGSKKARSIGIDAVVNMLPDDDVLDEGVQEEFSTQSIPWGMERIGVPSRPNAGKGVNVYVVDTGVRTTHQDFTGRAVPEVDVTSGSVVECNGDRSCSVDNRGHGTHCAGTAAGKTYGVASEAAIYGVKAIGDDGKNPWSWPIAAFDYLARNAKHPAVVSASLGAKGQDVSVKVAVEQLVNSGTPLVVAAGNDGIDACTFAPAYVPAAITVSAIGFTYSKAFFSNWGSCVDIWAPGMEILSASRKGDTASETRDGTSMACPHVSGAIALLREASPTMSPAQLLQTLQANAADDYVEHTKEGDTNKMVWVGASPAPSTRPAPGCRRRAFCWR